MSSATKILALFLALIAGCTDDITEATLNVNTLRIEMNGNKIDTAYLFTTYRDPGASFFENRRGGKNCNDFGVVSDIRGSVNTNLPGTYYLTYHAKDTSGNDLSPVTRTIVVVENKTNFLTGVYNVACTCTALAGLAKPVITTENYTAVVNPSSLRDHFELIPLEVGGEKLVTHPYLNTDQLELEYGFSSANYDWTSSRGTGTLSPSKNSFTLETIAQRFTPAIKYTCQNVYSRLVKVIPSK